MLYVMPAFVLLYSQNYYCASKHASILVVFEIIAEVAD